MFSTSRIHGSGTIDVVKAEKTQTIRPCLVRRLGIFIDRNESPSQNRAFNCFNFAKPSCRKLAGRPSRHKQTVAMPPAIVPHTSNCESGANVRVGYQTTTAAKTTQRQTTAVRQTFAYHHHRAGIDGGPGDHGFTREGIHQ